MTREALGYGCPVKGCQVLRNKSHLLCEVHWAKLPKALKQRVLNTWSRYIAAFRAPTWLPDGPDKQARVRAWQSAADAAIGWFNTGQERAA